ncbi:MAG: cysteine hydrolase [Oscillospiraceae bacterium]|nr:cysteine hydrolase [Oscillospiraceae bacterium]MBR2806217.1 cysteine hydrolase [Oscillospiraceae bacterium]
MKKYLIVVDMQNDFIDGSLGTPEAVDTVEYVKQKIISYPKECVIATMDTHGDDYMETHEGKMLPVKHCIKGTEGWEISPELKPCLEGAKIYEKPTFGCLEMANDLKAVSEKEDIEIELVGLCTDICVLSNALLLRAFMPEAEISVDARCCAGVTPELHDAALKTMQSCHIRVK